MQWGDLCCGLESAISASGSETTFAYDELDRQILQISEGRAAGGGFPASADVETHIKLSAVNQVLETRLVGGSNLVLISSNVFDLAGRLVKSINPAGHVTSNSFDVANRSATVTAPNGGTSTASTFLDGRPKTASGSATIARAFAYGVNPDGSTWSTVFTGPGGTNAAMWVKSTRDFMGRMIKSERPGFSNTVETAEISYNAIGQIEQSTSPGMAPVRMEYDELGRLVRSGLDIDRNGALDDASLDRIAGQDSGFVQSNGQWYAFSEQTILPWTNSNAVVVTSRNYTRLTGLGTGDPQTGTPHGETISEDIHGNRTITTTWLEPAAQRVTVQTQVPGSSNVAERVMVNGILYSSRDTVGITRTFLYDDLRRRVGVVDPRKGASQVIYNSAGQVVASVDAAGNTNSIAYHPDDGRVVAVTNAEGQAVRFDHNLRGQITHRWGGGAYPIRNVYDATGRQIELHTYRGGTNWTAVAWPAGTTGNSDKTTWQFESATGLLTNKVYADGKGPTYTYGVGGRLKTRTWVRTDSVGNPLTTTYLYDTNTAELVSIDYNDNTPDIGFTYGRFGEMRTVTDAVGLRWFDYNAQLQRERETITGQVNRVIERQYESGGAGQVPGRYKGLTLNTGYAVNYGYQGDGRMQSVNWQVDGQNRRATYGYLNNSRLIEATTIQSQLTNGTWQTTIATTKEYDPNRDLIQQVKNQRYDTGTSALKLLSQYDYTYNKIGQRMSVKNTGEAFTQDAFNLFEYNDKNELIQSLRYLGNDISNTNSPVPSEARRYQYDEIGNREEAEESQTGQPDHTLTTYLPNNLNLYLQITENGATNTPTHDADGNMTSEGMWNHSWNGKNRLVVSEEKGSPALWTNGSLKVSNTYDYMGRRVIKWVQQWDATNQQYTNKEQLRFVYDRWLMIQENSDQEPSEPREYIWGLDMQNSLQGLGGVGNLLSQTTGATGSKKTADFAYDANGNLTQALGSDGAKLYKEYDPYGGAVNGAEAGSIDLQFEFSTKYFDKETKLE